MGGGGVLQLVACWDSYSWLLAGILRGKSLVAKWNALIDTGWDAMTADDGWSVAWMAGLQASSRVKKSAVKKAEQ